MTSVRVPGFLPSQNGFHFENSWPAEPDIVIPTMNGPLAVGNAADGLCGGMAYAVRDIFETGAHVPAQTSNPAFQTPLFQYIVRRLFESFDIPSGVLAWMSWSLPTRNQAHDMVLTEWPAIRAQLSAGSLVALGLVRVRSFWPGDLGNNHQVLAWGFDEDATHKVSLYLYDPNHADDNEVTLAFDAAHPDAANVQFSSSRRATAEETTYGAFVTHYWRVDPRTVLSMVQSDWRWCHKCEGLFFGGNPGSRCPAGGAHDSAGSANYSLIQGVTAPGQSEWRWCRKCQGLWYAPNAGSVCPAGGPHEAVGSWDYVLLHDLRMEEGGQDGWRWCHKCQGLSYSGNRTQGTCAAGGQHDGSNSYDYVLPLGY